MGLPAGLPQSLIRFNVYRMQVPKIFLLMLGLAERFIAGVTQPAAHIAHE
jgi:hypothetical protein